MIFGLAVASVMLGAGCATAGAPSAPSPSASPLSSPSASPWPSATPGTPSPSPSVETTPAALRRGDSGPEVLRLQNRLTELGYWLGAPDGMYGDATFHALTAFQKIAGLKRDGVAGPATIAALARATRPGARSDSGSRIEVDLTRQVLLVVAKGRLQWVMDTSTGKVAGTTPKGHYPVYRQIDGYHAAPLGVLYRPKYFYQGVAVHGFPSVPPYPASHGCVRVTNATMDWLWSSGAMPIGTDVWVY